MWQEWNFSFIKEQCKATLKFYLRYTYGTDVSLQTCIVSWTFKKISLLFGTNSHHKFYTSASLLLHSVTAVRYPAFTSWKILINIFLCPSLFLPFRPSIQPTVYLYVCLPVCLRAHFSVRIFVFMFTYIHTHTWRSYFMNFVEVSIGYGVSRKNT